MIKHGYEDVNLENPLEGKLDKLIDYFVGFYGEENRKYIEERIKNTQFAFVDHSAENGLEQMEAHFKKLINEATSEADKEYLKSEEERLFELYYSSPVKRANLVYNEKRNKLVTDYITSKLGIEKSEEIISKLNQFVPTFITFISTPRDEITNAEWDIYTFMLGYFTQLAGNVEDGRITKLGEEKIKSLMGEDSKKLVKKVEDIEEKKFSAILNDKRYRDLFEGILDSGVIGLKESIPFIQNFMMSETDVGGGQFTSVDPKNPRTPVSLCILDTAMDLGTATLVHEVNHVISSSSSLISGHHEIRAGFNRMTTLIREDGSVLDLTGRASWKRYEALNEIANDYMTSKIFERMNEDGFKIGCYDEEPTIYSSVFPVVEMLFDEHMDELKQTYITGKNVFAEKIGESNFNHLADAVSEMLQFCMEYDKYQRVFTEVQTKQKAGGYFDIFELAYDRSIDWNDEQIEKYLASVRKIDEIIGEIDDYIDAGIEDDFEIENEDI